jgi:hypothetical protein
MQQQTVAEGRKQLLIGVCFSPPHPFLPGGSVVDQKPLHRKPIGESGPVRVTHTPGGETKIDWQKIEYPAEKPAQEGDVATAFVSSLNNKHNSDWRVTALDENNFDFEMQSGDEKRYLELQETIIPGKKRGPPYAPGEQVIEPAKFARTIIGNIKSKALRYSKTQTQPLDRIGVFCQIKRFCNS